MSAQTKSISIDDRIDEILQELATEVSSNQHELEHGDSTFTETRLADDEAIAEAKQAIVLELDKARIDELEMEIAEHKKFGAVPLRLTDRLKALQQGNTHE